MERFTVGDVVTVNFPYSNLKGQKIRPALVVAKAEFDNIILCQITSKSYSSKKSIKIIENDFTDGKLPIISYIRPDKLVTLEETLIQKKLGKLKKGTTQKILKLVQSLFK